jgi:tetratricopeptide (TPR) repeat protein
MQERGDLVQDEGGAWVEGPALDWATLPPRVEGIIQARIERLDEELQAFLSVASVEGETFTAQIVAQVQEVSERQILRRLSRELEARHRLVREQPALALGRRRLSRYRFAHALFQQHLYHALGDGERALLHGEIAAVLEELYAGRLGEVAVQLAHHYSAAGDDRRALKYRTLAGDVALAAYANREAEDYYRRALDLVPVGTEVAELLSSLGEALARQNRFQEAMDVWRDGIERYRTLGDGDAVAGLYARSAWAASQAGDPAEHLRLCLEGLARAGEAPDGPGRAGLLHETARAYMDQALREESEPYAQRGLEMAERLGHAELQAQALTTWSTSPRHSVEEGIALATRAVTLAEENGLLLTGQQAHTFLAFRLRARGDRPGARKHFRRGAELAGQAGLTAAQCSTLSDLARDYLPTGEFEKAEDALRQAHLLLEDLDEATYAAASVHSAEVHKLGFLGRWAACAERARPLLALLRERGATRDMAVVAIFLGWAILESLRFGTEAPPGDWEEAEAALMEATEVLDRSFSASIGIMTRGQWANLCLLQGRLADAQRLLAEANNTARVLSGPPMIEGHRLWLAAQVAAALGNWPEAMVSFEAACKILDRSGDCWWWARVLLAWAEAHSARGQPGDRRRAAKLLREAQEAFEDMGAPRYAAIAQKQLREMGRVDR